jgi:uncharacterized Rmd1/YagE family protein
VSEPTAAPMSIEAYCFESRFNLKELPGWLPAGAGRRATPTLIVVRVGGGGTIYGFDFGALVFANVARAEIDEEIADFQRRLPKEPHPPLRENFTLCVDTTKRAPEVSFDTVTLPGLTTLSLDCVATVLAQSVTIDYYDEDLTKILTRVGAVAMELVRGARVRTSRSDLVRFVASSIASQVEMINSILLLDKPDFTWDDEDAERLYDILRHHLDIPERYKALETKLATIRESLSQFLEIHAVRRSFVLEAAVVLLIVFEIVLALTERFSR